MAQALYSLRMRAERNGNHCCGAERIAPAAELPALAAELVARALDRGAAPDHVYCSLERIAEVISCRRLPSVRTFEVVDWMAGRGCAHALLRRAGVAPDAIAAALHWLTVGPAPGGHVMRGAMIIDARTGARLEADPTRGVRVSRMDLAPQARQTIAAALTAAGLGHQRVAEALVLAGKVLLAPSLVAELCWSDDPGYVTGYVADPDNGYQRITRLKEDGVALGGRALFVSSANWQRDEFVAFLERQAVVFDALGSILPGQRWES